MLKTLGYWTVLSHLALSPGFAQKHWHAAETICARTLEGDNNAAIWREEMIELLASIPNLGQYDFPDAETSPLFVATGSSGGGIANALERLPITAEIRAKERLSRLVTYLRKSGPERLLIRVGDKAIGQFIESLAPKKGSKALRAMDSILVGEVAGFLTFAGGVFWAISSYDFIPTIETTSVAAVAAGTIAGSAYHRFGDPLQKLTKTISESLLNQNRNAFVFLGTHLASWNADKNTFNALFFWDSVSGFQQPQPILIIHRENSSGH